MKFISERDMIREAIRQFIGTYGPKTDLHTKFKKKWDMVASLDPLTCTGDELREAIGTDSWGKETCHECQQEVTSIFQVGEEPNHEEGSANLCPSCVDVLIALRNQHAN